MLFSRCGWECKPVENQLADGLMVVAYGDSDNLIMALAHKTAQ